MTFDAPDAASKSNRAEDTHKKQKPNDSVSDHPIVRTIFAKKAKVAQ